MSRLVDAWQAALAAEHAAVFGYGVLGPHLSAADQDLARASERAHQTVRDGTEDALTAARVTPVAPLADYPELYPVADASAARRAAVGLEDRCTAAWRFLYLRAAATSGPLARRVRASAQIALTSGAVRAARWRSLSTPTDVTVAFPGT